MDREGDQRQHDSCCFSSQAHTTTELWGAITAAASDTIQLELESTDAVDNVRWELFDYPPGWAGPASGWLDDGNGVYYSVDILPAAFDLDVIGRGASSALRTTFRMTRAPHGIMSVTVDDDLLAAPRVANTCQVAPT